ncbi:MAG: hypothetical protein NC110_03020 [Ruminococcus sp.]|nr:hypothetical protein [Ruminococcus sp.]
MDETTTQVQNSVSHDNNFASITLTFFREVISLFKYIFYDVFLGRKP